VRVRGRLRARPSGTVNSNLASGGVELLAEELELLNRSEPLPFQLDEQVNEEVRLRYRYLDLRRDVMTQRLRLRHRLTRSMRAYLDARGFVDLETPMLTKATPEGARDYLVPSRTHPGKFFALPQSPQIFKQLLMIAGFDRYYQIVRCFRDEDLRADRQPEFTQLDIETSFLSQDQVMALMEGLVRHFFALAEKDGLPPKKLDTLALERMKQHRWPGNVRELENLARRLAALYPQDVITASVIDGELAPPAVTSGGAVHQGIDNLGGAVEAYLSSHFSGFPNGVPPPGLYHRILKEIEVPLLTAALAATRGNQIRAADLLGLNRNTLRKKIRDLDIQVYRSGG